MFASNKLASIAGFLLVVTLFLFEIAIPAAIAGNRVSGTLDAATILAYYNHPELIWPFWAGGIVLLSAMLFFLGIYGSLRKRASEAGVSILLMAAIGMGIAEVAVLTVEVSIQGSLVSLAGLHSASTSPSEKAALEAVAVGLFRFWDFLYNSLAYWLEAGYSILLTLVFMKTKAASKVVVALGILVGAYQVFNSTAILLGIPDMATIPGNLLLATWFVAVSVSILRLKPE